MEPISLRFPKDAYTLETHVYQGTEIVYRFYQDIPYCREPVDIKYQTLNVKEPVSIDGKAIDASHAPIFFGIGCAGGLSTTASSGGSFAPPDHGGPGGPKKKASEITSGEEWEAMAGGEGHEGAGIMGRAMLGSMPMTAPGPGPGGPEEMAPPDGSRWGKLALGFVVVEVGCRGRENQWPDGTFYGKYPAAAVDLKAAIRYIRHNAGVIPGDPEKIITTGGSGGAWMSTLLGASGNCPLFAPMLEAIGAADERDDIFITYSTSPIIDHEHADGAIEWQGGDLITDPALKPISDGLREEFRRYLDEARFTGRGGFGTLTADNLADYMMEQYLLPEAQRYLDALDETARDAYLQSRPWISYDGTGVHFSFADFGLYATRNAFVPVFDDLAMEEPQPNGYGDEHIAAQHFTDFALRLATGDPNAEVPQSVTDRVHLSNPIWHIRQQHSDLAPHWWIRHGACDPCIALPPIVLLAAEAERAGKDVNCRLIWDGGHCADDDQDAFLRWVMETTGYHI